MIKKTKETKEKPPRYEKISPTAKFVAFLRTYSDIPYSQELSDRSHAKEDSSALWDGREETIKYMAPQFEARYTLVTDIIERLGIKQILEIAAGLSVRGLMFTEDKNIMYVETDLPGIIKEKADIIEGILSERGEGKRSNLVFQEADAFESGQVLKAIKYFSPKSIAIVSEGLLTYLNREEIERLSASLHTILSKRKGFWITDVPSKAFSKMLIEESGQHMDSMTKKTAVTVGRPIISVFEDNTEIEEFFSTHGFEIIESHPYSEIIDKLTCIKRLDLDQQKVFKYLSLRNIFVLKAV